MTTDRVLVDERYITNGDGWLLYLKRTHAPAHLDPTQRPILLVPGYGMNTFNLGHHPSGTSMEATFARAGFEVWSTCLRTQGDSRKVGRHAAPPTLRAFAETDLAAIVRAVMQATASTQDALTMVGCSLGGTVAYGYLALVPDHRVGALITIGAPLVWEAMHPAMKVLFRSRRLARLVRIKGTRTMARKVFPIAARIPKVLDIYINSKHLDLDKAAMMTEGVDDPHHRVNVDIAQWVRDKELILDGVNVGHALRNIHLPLLVILANNDGIVPPASALSVQRFWGSDDQEVLNVGTPEDWYAHADLFIAPEAPTRVFDPMIAWMQGRP